MLKAIHFCNREAWIYSDPKHALTRIMYTCTNMHSNLNEINRMLSSTLTDNLMHQVVLASFPGLPRFLFFGLRSV